MEAEDLDLPQYTQRRVAGQRGTSVRTWDARSGCGHFFLGAHPLRKDFEFQGKDSTGRLPTDAGIS